MIGRLSLRLIVTVCGSMKGGIFSTKLEYEAQMINLPQNCHTKNYSLHCRIALVSYSLFLPTKQDGFNLVSQFVSIIVL
ncbi:hypothetical protein BH11BAC2_BH11BAC2_13900 [soil metagenome]